jgi:hypothetical protein
MPQTLKDTFPDALSVKHQPQYSPLIHRIILYPAAHQDIIHYGSDTPSSRTLHRVLVVEDKI